MQQHHQQQQMYTGNNNNNNADYNSGDYSYLGGSHQNNSSSQQQYNAESGHGPLPHFSGGGHHQGAAQNAADASYHSNLSHSSQLHWSHDEVFIPPAQGHVQQSSGNSLGSPQNNNLNNGQHMQQRSPQHSATQHHNGYNVNNEGRAPDNFAPGAYGGVTAADTSYGGGSASGAGNSMYPNNGDHGPGSEVANVSGYAGTSCLVSSNPQQNGNFGGNQYNISNVVPPPPPQPVQQQQQSFPQGIGAGGDAFGEDDEEEELLQPSSTVINSEVSNTKKPDDTPGSTVSSRNLFISGLPSTVSDVELRSMFEKFGVVSSAKVMLNIRTGVSRGFGFVMFENSEEAKEAMKNLHGQPAPGSTSTKLKISYSEHKGQNLKVKSSKLYVRNIPAVSQLVPSELLDFFGSYGEITGLQCRNDPYQTPTNTSGGASGTTQLTDAPVGAPPPVKPSVMGTTTPSNLEANANKRAEWEKCLVPSGKTGNTAMRVLFVEFTSCDDARRCVDATHNSMPFASCTTPLLAKIFEPQELRDQRLKEQNEIKQKSQRHAGANSSGRPAQTTSQYPQQRLPPVPQHQMYQGVPGSSLFNPPPNMVVPPPTAAHQQQQMMVQQQQNLAMQHQTPMYHQQQQQPVQNPQFTPQQPNGTQSAMLPGYGYPQQAETGFVAPSQQAQQPQSLYHQPQYSQGFTATAQQAPQQQFFPGQQSQHDQMQLGFTQAQPQQHFQPNAQAQPAQFPNPQQSQQFMQQAFQQQTAYRQQ